MGKVQQLCANLFSQETLALDKASEEAEDAKLNLASELENATIFMKIKRGDEWDGSRVEVRHTADQLRHQVRCCVVVVVVSGVTVENHGHDVNVS